LLEDLTASAPNPDERLVMNPLTMQDMAMLAQQRGQPMPPEPPQRLAMQMPPQPLPPQFARPQMLAQVKPKPVPLAPVPAPAPAGPAPSPQPAAQAGIASWLVQCPPQSTTGCQMVRRTLRADGQQLLGLIVGPDRRQPGKLVGTVLLPLGVAVRESVPMLIDDRFIALLPVDTCLPAGCLMSIAMSPQMAEALRNGGVIKFLALSTDGQTIPLSLPLGGFGEALAKVAG
jgi:invasion protein IalB